MRTRHQNDAALKRRSHKRERAVCGWRITQIDTVVLKIRGKKDTMASCELLKKTLQWKCRKIRLKCVVILQSINWCFSGCTLTKLIYLGLKKKVSLCIIDLKEVANSSRCSPITENRWSKITIARKHCDNLTISFEDPCLNSLQSLFKVQGSLLEILNWKGPSVRLLYPASRSLWPSLVDSLVDFSY